jgi:3-oxoacyl-[acyl-carrier protein] reductase
MRLEGTTIVVTGASRGLGRAMADAYVDAGARVVYSSRGGDRLTAAVDEANEGARPGSATAIPADVRSWIDVQALVEDAIDRFGDLDVLVNNAGVTQSKVNPAPTEHPVHALPVETWDTILETNLRGAFLAAKAILPPMLDRWVGRLIHVSSGHGIVGRANRAAYVASKFGLEGFHETLARELEGTGLDSVALRPPDGGVYTEGASAIGRTPAEFAHPDPGVIAEAAVQLAAGAGENGGRYKATPDGDGYVTYSKTERS